MIQAYKAENKHMPGWKNKMALTWVHVRWLSKCDVHKKQKCKQKRSKLYEKQTAERFQIPPDQQGSTTHTDTHSRGLKRLQAPVVEMYYWWYYSTFQVPLVGRWSAGATGCLTNPVSPLLFFLVLFLFWGESLVLFEVLGLSGWGGEGQEEVEDGLTLAPRPPGWLYGALAAGTWTSA